MWRIVAEMKAYCLRFLEEKCPHLIIYRLTIRDAVDDDSTQQDLFFLTDKAAARFIKGHKVSLINKTVIVGGEPLWLI